MTAIVALWVGVLLVLALRHLLRPSGLRPRRQNCPSCAVPMLSLHTDTDYQVLACPRCANAATVAPSTHRAPRCPSCGQCSLLTPCVRVASSAPCVDVHEQCPNCGHQRIHQLPSEDPVRGLVIPFPTDEVARGPQ